MKKKRRRWKHIHDGMNVRMCEYTCSVAWIRIVHTSNSGTGMWVSEWSKPNGTSKNERNDSRYIIYSLSSLYVCMYILKTLWCIPLFGVLLRHFLRRFRVFNVNKFLHTRTLYTTNDTIWHFMNAFAPTTFSPLERPLCINISNESHFNCIRLTFVIVS